MKRLVVVGQYVDFPSASIRAKDLAQRFKERIEIQRTAIGWSVLVSRKVADTVKPQAKEQDTYSGYEDESSDPYEEDYQREVAQPLVEELQSDQDSWSRSDDDGWFYED